MTTYGPPDDLLQSDLLVPPEEIGAAPDHGPEPTVGRIVHYTGYEYPADQPIAAIITQVFPPEKGQPRKVRLDIRWPVHAEPMPSEAGHHYHYAETPTPGHWNWPPRA